MESVHVLNLNQVIGTITNEKGEFAITAAVNDTLISHLSWDTNLKKSGSRTICSSSRILKIALTELAYALEEVVVRPYQLTGYLEIDVKNMVTSEGYQYSISGLNFGYEAGNKSPSAVTKVSGRYFEPGRSTYAIFSDRKPNQMRKLRKMKEDDEIRNLACLQI